MQGASVASRGSRGAAAVACLLLAGASFLVYRQNRALYDDAETFARRAGFQQSRAGETRVIQREPSGDLACAAAVAAAIKETAGRNTVGGDAGGRAVLGSDELRVGRELMVAALRYRPGWALHRFVLGQVAYEEEKRAAGSERRRPELWAEPLRLASSAAPGFSAISAVRARALLYFWRELPASERDLAPAVIERAFRNPEFVSEQFEAAAAALGRNAVVRLLPDNPDALSRAIQVFTHDGDVAQVAVLTARWETAERAERAADLALAEERARVEDIEELRWRCPDWVYKHPPSELDDPATSSQAARILALWPLDRQEPWGSDPRTTLTQYFLEEHQTDIDGALLLRVVNSLTGVPDPVRARVRALAGDLDGAKEIAARGAAVDRARWTPVFLEIARAHFKTGLAAEAWLVLEGIAPADQESCNVLLARRDVARALGNRVELGAVTRSLDLQKVEVQSQPSWSAQGSLSLCLDPEQTTGQRLSIELDSPAAALVVWGWDGYLIGRVTVPPGRSSLAVPLTGVAGRRTLTVRPLVGAAVHTGGVSLDKEREPASPAAESRTSGT